MEYEKKYNDLIARINEVKEKPSLCMKDKHHYSGYVETGIRDALDYIINPETEDERIRTRLIALVEAFGQGKYKDEMLAYLEKQKEQKPIIQDVELNDAVYDYVRDHFIAGADFTPEYIKKLMENAFFAGVDYYLLKQESESCEPDTNVEKVIEDVIRVYGKTQGEWVGGYDVDTLIVNLRRAFNKKEQKPAEWSEEDEEALRELLNILSRRELDISDDSEWLSFKLKNWRKSLRPQPSGNFAISFMNYLDEHRPDGKMCLSNGECADIETAFKKEDWAKVIRYVNKYQPHWKPSKEQMDHLAYAYTQLKLQKCYAPHVYESLGSLYDDLKKLI